MDIEGDSMSRTLSPARDKILKRDRLWTIRSSPTSRRLARRIETTLKGEAHATRHAQHACAWSTSPNDAGCVAPRREQVGTRHVARVLAGRRGRRRRLEGAVGRRMVGDGVAGGRAIRPKGGGTNQLARHRGRHDAQCTWSRNVRSALMAIGDYSRMEQPCSAALPEGRAGQKLNHPILSSPLFAAKSAAR